MTLASLLIRQRAVLAAALAACLLVFAATTGTSRPTNDTFRGHLVDKTSGNGSERAFLFNRALLTKGPRSDSDKDEATPAPSASFASTIPSDVPCGSYAVFDMFGIALSVPGAAATEPTQSDLNQLADATRRFFTNEGSVVGWKIEELYVVPPGNGDGVCDSFDTVTLPDRFNYRFKMSIMPTLLTSNCRDDDEQDATPESGLADALQVDYAIFVSDYLPELTGNPFASANETAYTVPFSGDSCEDIHFSHAR